MDNWAMGVAVLGAAGATAALLYTKSSKAKELGISNIPDSISDWVDLTLEVLPNAPKILAVLKEQYPNASVSSAYRNDAVNHAVGGVDESRHTMGLAVDFDVGGDVLGAATYLRTQVARLPVMRTVIAETTPYHVHVDFFAPGETVAACKWRKESGGENNFIPM